jgi:hypothetical protein
VSIILKRSDAGETVFTEHRRGQVIFVVPFAILCVPGTFIFYLLPDSGGLGTDILMSFISVAMLSLVIGVAASEALRHRNRLTVTSEAITFLRWGDGRETTLRHGDGGRLLIISKNLGAVLPRDRILTQLGTGRVIGLYGFSRRVVRRACERRGWSFDYDPGLGERHLRLWRDWGSRDWYWLKCAASLVAACGPVDVAAEPGGQVSLGAAILGEYAASYLPQGDQDRHEYQHYRERQSKDYAYWKAADAYRFAAKAQRSFATLTSSPGETAARLTEADKFQAKAESSKAQRRTVVTR